jgi:hypothetical protein
MRPDPPLADTFTILNPPISISVVPWLSAITSVSSNYKASLLADINRLAF